MRRRRRSLAIRSMCRDQDGCSAEMLRAPDVIAGLEVGELRLPKDTVVSLIIRDERPFYPTAGSGLRSASCSS
jgi:hypothetical protein